MHIFSLSAHLWPPYAHMHIFPFSLTVDKTPGRERDKIRDIKKEKESEREQLLYRTSFISPSCWERMLKKGLCGVDLRHQVAVIGVLYSVSDVFRFLSMCLLPTLLSK